MNVLKAYLAPQDIFLLTVILNTVALANKLDFSIFQSRILYFFLDIICQYFTCLLVVFRVNLLLFTELFMQLCLCAERQIFLVRFFSLLYDYLVKWMITHKNCFGKVINVWICIPMPVFPFPTFHFSSLLSSFLPFLPLTLPFLPFSYPFSLHRNFLFSFPYCLLGS